MQQESKIIGNLESRSALSRDHSFDIGKGLSSIYPIAALSCKALILLAFFVSLGWAKWQILQEEQLFQDLSLAQINNLDVAELRPEFNEESIAFATILYNIQIPKVVRNIEINKNIPDRGQTISLSWSAHPKVLIGENSFSSWSLLGSTLAHEIEVHCRQNVYLIRTLDIIGFDGTTEAERQAYLYEIKNAKRFGLKMMDQVMIYETLEYFYPKSKNNLLSYEQIKTSVNKWLARRFVEQ